MTVELNGKTGTGLPYAIQWRYDGDKLESVHLEFLARESVGSIGMPVKKDRVAELLLALRNGSVIHDYLLT